MGAKRALMPGQCCGVCRHFLQRKSWLLTAGRGYCEAEVSFIQDRSTETGKRQPRETVRPGDGAFCRAFDARTIARTMTDHRTIAAPSPDGEPRKRRRDGPMVRDGPARK
jgi:hypothetical protein